MEIIFPVKLEKPTILKWKGNGKIMNTINTYGYMVIRNKGGIPLHVVEIYHNMLACFSVFNNAKDATNFIKSEKESLSKYTPLVYNPDFSFAENLVKIYCESENLKSRIDNKQLYLAF